MLMFIKQSFEAKRLRLTSETAKCSGCNIPKTLVTELPKSSERVKIVKYIRETLFSMTQI